MCEMAENYKNSAVDETANFSIQAQEKEHFKKWRKGFTFLKARVTSLVSLADEFEHASGCFCVEEAEAMCNLAEDPRPEITANKDFFVVDASASSSYRHFD